MTAVAPYRSERASQLWAAATVAVVGLALLLQLVLVVTGASVLAETSEPPALLERLWRLVSYFTIQSNVLVLVTTWPLVVRPDRDGRVWRIARADAIAGITVTGVVHFFFLRPLLHLTGWSLVADKLLHVAVPVMAVAGWLAFGPRGRVAWPTVPRALVWPLAWLAYTLAVGAANGWYPYPFIDVTKLGYGTVLLNCVGVAVVLLIVLGALVLLDRPLARERTPERVAAGR